ncbi:MAG TPA: D-2-hydroxyacid dehydrogenase [Patescibacteria group bacterium]|nr:D-2-hydroxyacid dehydrogenase [Patescibacteria group bacterium]
MSTINIVVLNQLGERHKAAILKEMPDAAIQVATLEQAPTYMPDCNILAVWGWMNAAPLCQAAPHLRWVHALTAGVEGLMVPEFQQSPVLLTNSRGIHGIPVSEHVLALMLTFSRGIHHALRQQAESRWQRFDTGEIYEKTLAIVGLGSIGREIAKKAKAMGMRVLASKQTVTQELFVDKLYPADNASLCEMLSQADFVIVALPLMDETKEMFRLEHFTAMKQHACFINIARGGVVRETDLVTALEQRLIGCAGLDVFTVEPLPSDSPLWSMPNVIITPHVAALSPAYLDRAIQLFTDNLARFAAGGDMLNIINKQRGY